MASTTERGTGVAETTIFSRHTPSARAHASTSSRSRGTCRRNKYAPTRRRSSASEFKASSFATAPFLSSVSFAEKSEKAPASAPSPVAEAIFCVCSPSTSWSTPLTSTRVLEAHSARSDGAGFRNKNPLASTAAPFANATDSALGSATATISVDHRNTSPSRSARHAKCTTPICPERVDAVLSTASTPNAEAVFLFSSREVKDAFREDKDASLSRAARSAREAARATSSLWNGMDRVRQNSATASDRRSFRSSSSRGASTSNIPRRLPISARASVFVSFLSSFRTPSRDSETRAPFGRSASHASANFVSFRFTYRSVASHRLSSCVLSVASSSISHLESTGLNRKYFAFGMSGMSVRSDSSTRSTEQHDSRTTFCKSFSFPPLSALDASRRRGAYAPEPKLTTQSMFLSGHKRRASITPSIAGLLHVTAPSCHLSSPCW